MSYPGLPALIGNQFYGVKDRCLEFVNATDTVNFTNGTWGQYIHGQSAMTMEAWVRFSAINDASYVIFEPIDSSWLGFSLRVFSTGVLDIAGRSIRPADAGESATGTTVLAINTWYHLCGVINYTAKTITSYINGNLEKHETGLSFASNTYTMGTPSIVSRIGNHSISGRNVEGKIDEVRIWNHARTAEQIKRYIHTRLYGTETGLVAYYPMDEGTGSTAYDMSQNSNNGTITGATWIKP